MRLALAVLLLTLLLPAATGQEAQEAEEEPLESTAVEPPSTGVSPATLQGASGVLLFTAFGASLGAVIALGRYHKRRRTP